MFIQYPQHIVINPSMLTGKSFPAKVPAWIYGSEGGGAGDEETFVPAPALDPLFCCKSSWLQSTEHSQAPDSRNSRHSCETLSETSWDLRDERLVMSPLNHQRSNVFLLFLSLLTLLSEGEASLGDNKLICLFTFWFCTCDDTSLSLSLSLVRSLAPSLSLLSSSLPLKATQYESLLFLVYWLVCTRMCECRRACVYDNTASRVGERDASHVLKQDCPL